VSQTRRLAAILAADVAGYSRLMGADEEGTLERLKSMRRELLDPKIAEHRGRVVKTTGDGLLVEFASVVDAVRCAVAVQRAMPERNTGVAADSRIELRIGINLGDVIVEGDDLYGDGVNIAARIEALADAGGVFVSNTVHDHVRDRLPFAFDNLGEQQVKNIARPVRVYRVRTSPTPSPARRGPPSLSRTAGEGAERQRREAGEGSSPVLPLPEKPSIAVLPFANMSGDPEQEYFADGMVEEIITGLSRVGWFFVIARNSSFTYKGRAVDIRQVGRDLGVRYVLEGSVRKAGNRVRITGQLIDATDGRHVWADRFDGDLDDIFELQDRITHSVVAAITPTLRRAEFARAWAKPTSNLAAYDLYLRALERHYTQLRPATDVAIELLQRAIEMDPGYAGAKALLSTVYVWRTSAGWSNPAEARTAIALARDVVSSGPDDPDALGNAAHTFSYLAHDYERALAILARAIKLNPNSAQTLSITGWVYVHCCDPEPAIDVFQRAVRLSPLDQEMGLMLWGIGVAHLIAGRNEQSLTFLHDTIREMPNYPMPNLSLILAFVRLNRLGEARAAADRLLQIDPSWRISRTSPPFRDQSFIEESRAAMRLAGLPE
jgi:adenylate cyclase